MTEEELLRRLLLEHLQRGADGSEDAPYREARRFATDEFTNRAYNDGVSDGIEWAIEQIKKEDEYDKQGGPVRRDVP